MELIEYKIQMLQSYVALRICEIKKFLDAKTQETVVWLFQDFLNVFLCYLWYCLQNAFNSFSIWLSLEKYVREKFSLCLFHKKFLEFVCFLQQGKKKRQKFLKNNHF